MFKSATIKLTLWYVLIVMILCLIFSGVIYHFSNNELAYTGYFDELPDPIHFRGGALINVKDIKNNGYIKYYLSLSQGAGIWKKLHDS